jgi:hypothetical protein
MSRAGDLLATPMRDDASVTGRMVPTENEEAPMTQHTFVLSRRINRVPGAVERALPALTGEVHAGLTFRGTFEHHALIGPWGSAPSERRAAAALRTTPSRVEEIDVELAPWSRRETELRLRPSTHRPDRWSARRQLRYFERAHEAIDALARAIERETPASAPRPAEVAAIRRSA